MKLKTEERIEKEEEFKKLQDCGQAGVSDNGAIWLIAQTPSTGAYAGISRSSGIKHRETIQWIDIETPPDKSGDYLVYALNPYKDYQKDLPEIYIADFGNNKVWTASVRGIYGRGFDVDLLKPIYWARLPKGKK